MMRNGGNFLKGSFGPVLYRDQIQTPHRDAPNMPQCLLQSLSWLRQVNTRLFLATPLLCAAAVPFIQMNRFASISRPSEAPA